MPIYECIHCKKKYENKNHYNRHINRKFSCNSENKNAVNCQNKSDILNELYAEINILKSKIAELESNKNRNMINCANTATNSHNNNHNINNSNNTQNITNNNINLVAFGKEDLDNFISDKECKKFLKKGFQGVPELIKYVHFNKDNPQYHNCFISNMRDCYANVFDGKEQKLEETSDVIKTLRGDKQLFLENKFKEFSDEDDLDETTKKRFNKFLAEADTTTIKKRYNKALKLMLYNERNIIIDTKANNQKNINK